MIARVIDRLFRFMGALTSARLQATTDACMQRVNGAASAEKTISFAAVVGQNDT